MAENKSSLKESKYWIKATRNNFKEIIKGLLDKKLNFIIYLYGTHDEKGRSWCPDCEVSQPLVENVLPKINKFERQKELYFVNIEVDFDKRDIFKNDKIIKMRRIPTLIYFSNGVEMERLIEKEMASQEALDSFVDQI